MTVSLTEKISEYWSDDSADRSIDGNEANKPQVSAKFKKLLGRPWVQKYKGDPGELKNRLTAIGKKQLIYELSEVETALLAYDAPKRPVSEFI